MKYRLKVMMVAFVVAGACCTIGFADAFENNRKLVDDNTAFAVDLYKKLATPKDNLFFSPYSISTALSMAYAGARGETETQMAKTLRFSLEQKDLHSAFVMVGAKVNNIKGSKNIKLNVANSLWPQKKHPFLGEYLLLVKKNYGVGIYPVDYKKNARDVRKTINKWVEKRTENKITELIKRGMIRSSTRLVLVNAIYFKGDWEHEFDKKNTKDAPFRISSRKSVEVPMMSQSELTEYRYKKMKNLEVLEMPYTGKKVSMVVLLPKASYGIKKLEEDLSAKNLNKWRSDLREEDVFVVFPKFKTTASFALKDQLETLGMVDAFDPSKANFAGMDGKSSWLYFSEVVHKAYVDVSEKGTEAAAATAVIMQSDSGVAEERTPVLFRADRPFIFIIQEKVTKSILFMGKVTDPRKTGE